MSHLHCRNTVYGHDILNDYFIQHVPFVNSPRRSVRIHHTECIPSHLPIDSFDEANSLFFSQFSIRPGLIEESMASVPQLAVGAYIGIHFRSTDKGLEAILPGEDDFFRLIDRALDDRTDLLYVATDNAAFVNTCSSRYGQRLVFREDSIRSVNERPIHQSKNGDGRLKSLDAIANIIILSNASMLIKTPSALSGFAKVLNPLLETHMIGELRSNSAWFPDCLFRRQRQTADVRH